MEAMLVWGGCDDPLTDSLMTNGLIWLYWGIHVAVKGQSEQVACLSAADLFPGVGVETIKGQRSACRRLSVHQEMQDYFPSLFLWITQRKVIKKDKTCLQETNSTPCNLPFLDLLRQLTKLLKGQVLKTQSLANLVAAYEAGKCCLLALIPKRSLKFNN